MILTIGLLIVLIFFMINSNLSQIAIYQTSKLFLTIIIPSFLPTFIISQIITNHLKQKLTKSTSYRLLLFLMAHLTGNPTSCLLTIDSYKSGLITKQDLLTLITFTSALNPILLINLAKAGYFSLNISLFIIITNFIFNLLGFIIFKSKQTIKFNSSKSTIKLFDLNRASIILINILLILWVINLIKVPIDHIINTKLPQLSFLNYFLVMIEVTTGLKKLSLISNLLLKNCLIIWLATFNGVSIIIQTINVIKKEPQLTETQNKQLVNYYWLTRIILATILTIIYLLKT